MKRLGIFTVIGTRRTQIRSQRVVEMLAGCRPYLDHLILVSDISENQPFYDDVAGLVDEIVPTMGGRARNHFQSQKKALTDLGADGLAPYDELLLFDTNNFGPVVPLGPVFDEMATRDCAFWSINHYRPKYDKRLVGRIENDILPKRDFIVYRRPCLDDPAFMEFWEKAEDQPDYFESLVQNEMTLPDRLILAGHRADFFVDPATMDTFDPAVMQALPMLKQGSPLVPRDIFIRDPISAEMEALEGRRVLDWLEAQTEYDTKLIWDSLIDMYPLRTLHTNMEELRVIEDAPPITPKTTWTFGKVAVFAHVFYANMTDEFVERVMLIPGDVAFYATTASDEHKIQIEARVRELGFTGFLEVRVVEQNRGRDMSSLFITFRDVVLSGEFGLCLRLHSKRTPQMSAQLGMSFKEHMFENLVPSTGYISRLFDLFEANPNVGIVIPSTVHIGYGTLGHSWFANKPAFEKVAKEMGLKVPFDTHTPVAAYGTMYWFRPDALRLMFEKEWQWEDFNPEPHHIDGGLAHVQERLICYAVQAQKYRTISVLNPALAARNYVKLEYKYQLLASYYPTGDIRQMVGLAALEKKGRMPLFSRGQFFWWVAQTYIGTKARWPWFWKVTQPIVPIVWPKMQRTIERDRNG